MSHYGGCFQLRWFAPPGASEGNVSHSSGGLRAAGRQNFRRLLILFLTLLLACLSDAAPARAGGIILYELGTPDVGLAAAGYAARAQDASTLFTNPAGMSRLEKSEFLAGGQGLYGNLAFSPDGATTVGGSDGGNGVGFVPGGSLFYVHKLSRDIGIGIGAFSYFGAAEEFDDDWVGRYYVTKASLIGFTVMPAISYRVSDWLSVGAGLNAMYGILEQKAAINNILASDGVIKVSDQIWGLGANLGVLVEPVQGTRIGLTYLSPVELELKATPDITNSGPVLAVLNARGLMGRRLDLDVTVPQSIMFSVFHSLSEKWAVMGNVGWQDWSEFGKVDVSVDSPDTTSLTVDLNFQDTWHVALGAQYMLSEAWRLSGGVAYDSSAVKSDDRTLTLPIGETWRFGLGAQWMAKENIELGAAYEFAWSGDLSVDQTRGPLAGRVSGEFSNTAVHFLALNARWSF